MTVRPLTTNLRTASWSPRLSIHLLRVCKNSCRPNAEIVDVDQPPVGELPTENGFIVLNLTETRVLFGRTTAVRELRFDERLSAFEIPKALLATYSGDHLREALLETRTRAAQGLKSLRQRRGHGNPQRLGRRHAFLALLFASTALALDDMPGGALPQRA